MSAGSRSGRELDAVERGVNGRRQGADGERLGQARHAFQEHVAVGEQAHQQPVHQLLLADDHLGDLPAQFADPGGRGLHFFVQRYAHVRRNLGTKAPLTQVICGDTMDARPAELATQIPPSGNLQSMRFAAERKAARCDPDLPAALHLRCAPAPR